MKRVKLPSIKTVRNRCDALLTPIIQKMFPHCLLCGARTEVGHHHVHKSSSNMLRYEIINIIPLCNSCHCALHNNESYYASKIVLINGTGWFKTLEKLKRETVKCDIHWYLAHYERLQEIYRNL